MTAVIIVAAAFFVWTQAIRLAVEAIVFMRRETLRMRREGEKEEKRKRGEHG